MYNMCEPACVRVCVRECVQVCAYFLSVCNYFSTSKIIFKNANVKKNKKFCAYRTCVCECVHEVMFCVNLLFYMIILPLR